MRKVINFILLSVFFLGWRVSDKNVHGMNNINLIILTSSKVSNLIMLSHVLNPNKGYMYYLVYESHLIAIRNDISDV